MRQLQDVLQRVTISNALRLLPLKVRGFKFLQGLKMHMKSYNPDDHEVGTREKLSYPKLKLSSGIVQPQNSSFDRFSKKRKRKFTDFAQESSHGDDVRIFHEKF